MATGDGLLCNKVVHANRRRKDNPHNRSRRARHMLFALVRLEQHRQRRIRPVHVWMPRIRRTWRTVMRTRDSQSGLSPPQPHSPPLLQSCQRRSEHGVERDWWRRRRLVDVIDDGRVESMKCLDDEAGLYAAFVRWCWEQQPVQASSTVTTLRSNVALKRPHTARDR